MCERPSSADLFDSSDDTPSPNASDTVDNNYSVATLVKNKSVHDVSDSDDDNVSSQTSTSAKSSNLASRKQSDSPKQEPNSFQVKTQLSNSTERQKRPLYSSQETKRPLESPQGQKRPRERSEDTRPLCKYGDKCYRKNTQHKTEFRHPGEPSVSDKPSPPIKRPRVVTYDQSTAAGTPTDIIAHAQPFSFLLTRVEGINDKYNQHLSLGIKDILSPSMGKLEASAQFNYLIQIPWLLRQYPSESRDKPLLLVHGEQKTSKLALEREAKAYPNVTLCQAKLEIMYGTHHSKMMLLLYKEGLRVVIHTANLHETDWKQKSQGMWISPVFPPSDKPAEDTDSTTNFKRDLMQYIQAYNIPTLNTWLEHICRHDMTSARVYLIGSVPGRHQGENKHRWGHLKLRKILQQNGPLASEVRKWPVIGQFSSIGSMGPKAESWLTGEFLHSLAARQGAIGQGNEPLKLIFPTKDNIRTSLEGYPAGASVPYSINVAKKQVYLHSYFSQWRSECRGRSRASPHIKTYLRMSPDNDDLAWFLVTSANLSKAAWGAQEKNGFQLMIRSYEMGVLFLPQSFKCKKFSIMKSMSDYQRDHCVFPVPYDLPLTPYGPKDRPWIWDIPYVDLPDTNGNSWCPP